MENRKVLICGLPESGKTTFIAALWYLVSQKEIPTALSRLYLPKNREYLNSLSDKWVRFKQTDRTQTDEIQEILIALSDGVNKIDLLIPDMSGETWKNIWTNRLFAENAGRWAIESSAIMLFLHSDIIRHPIDILTANSMKNSTGEELGREFHKDWSPKDSPTQVILVEILQSLSMPPIGKKGRRLVVVISAWDKAKDTGHDPEKYIKVQLPLLYQFLKFTDRFSEIRFFGISALGGDLNSPEDTEKLKKENIPSKRIKVVSGQKIDNDLTVPIKWLISK